MSKFVQWVVVAATLLSCVGCDQATKAVAKEYLSRHEIVSFANDMFRLQYTENAGAFLSIGATLPEQTRKALFVGAISVILLGILGYLLIMPGLPVGAIVSLSLIVGGGVSNLIDRVAYDGYVVDFLNIGIGNIRTGIFNIADVAITAGAIALIVGNLRHKRNVAGNEVH